MTLYKSMRRTAAAAAALVLLALTGCSDSEAAVPAPTATPSVSVGTWAEESAGLLDAAQRLIDEVKKHPESFPPATR